MCRLALTFFIFLVSLSSYSAQKPNIVLIYADDISARELPIYGSSKWSSPPYGEDTSELKHRASTPVLDQLATDGLWVKNAWATTICSPSRAMMMTGRYAHKHKWWHNKDKGVAPQVKGSKNNNKSWPLYESSPHTIGHIAKAGGYATYWAGKTQMSGVDKFGFDEAVFTPGDNNMATNPNTYSDFTILNTKRNGKKALINTDSGVYVDYYQQFGWYWQPHVQLMNHPSSNKAFEWWPNTPESKASYGLSTYGPDVELDFIFDFMQRKQKQNKPFFIYHTTHLGHDGWDFFSQEIRKNKRQKWPGTPKVTWDGDKYIRTTPKVTGDKGQYNTHGTVTEGGMHTHVNYLDYQVWQYLEKFKQMGIENNTVFIFAADNGTSHYGKGSINSQRGTHVPLIIYAPALNMTKKGEQDVLANMADILPTIADIVGVEVPASYEINGQSLLPFLTSEKTTHRDWIYAYHKDKQLIRSQNVLIDGTGKIFDVSKTPNDLISFPVIKNIKQAKQSLQTEYQTLKSVLPRFDLHKTAHDAPVDGYGKISPLVIKK
ncbi:sulfatase-like hydrolase/transferase [Paraglaciecola sp.]|uniref:sulfatase-like hydrolase/transferase n=1 Tax=Paraglaciecola sp. TaxID=1920173 RepID=UPI003EF9FEB7